MRRVKRLLLTAAIVTSVVLLFSTLLLLYIHRNVRVPKCSGVCPLNGCVHEAV